MDSVLFKHGGQCVCYMLAEPHLGPLFIHLSSDAMAISLWHWPSTAPYLLGSLQGRQTHSFQLCSVFRSILFLPAKSSLLDSFLLNSCLLQVSCTYPSLSFSSTDALHRVYKEIWNKNKNPSTNTNLMSTLQSLQPFLSSLPSLLKSLELPAFTSRIPAGILGGHYHALHVHLALDVSSSP